MAAEEESAEPSLDAVEEVFDAAAESVPAETEESGSVAPISSDPQTASDSGSEDAALSDSDNDSALSAEIPANAAEDTIDASADIDSSEDEAAAASMDGDTPADGEAEDIDETDEDALDSEEAGDQVNAAADASLDSEEAPNFDGVKTAPDFSTTSNGWQLLNSTWYYVSNHAATTGWLKSGDNWYYLDPNNNGAMATGLIDIDGDGRYYLSSSGAMSTGWVYTKPEGEKVSSWYYFGSSGRGVNGWLKSGKSWYYFDPQKKGAMATGLIDIDGDGRYYLSSSGAMNTGWVYAKPEGEKVSAWYYFGSSGRGVNGWLKSGKSWYYLDPQKKGAMATGLIDIDGDGQYYLSSSGVMKTGWINTTMPNENTKAWYYFASSGRKTTGWLKTGSVWTTKYYYLDPENNGAMVTGWNDIDNARYHMAANGSVTTGWLAEKNDWYYFDVLGKMITGWAFIDSNDYYFYKDTDEGATLGTMARDTVIDERAIDEDGHSELPEMAEELSYQDKMTIRAQYYSSDTSNLMILDRSVCKVYLFTGSTGDWKLSNIWSCSPGYRTTPTPSGTFVTQDHGYYFDSESARCFWWTQFYGSYCLHSTLYHQNGLSPSTASVMNATLGARISHGCVRLSTSTAKWVHDNIKYGTRLIVY